MTEAGRFLMGCILLAAALSGCTSREVDSQESPLTPTGPSGATQESWSTFRGGPGLSGSFSAPQSNNLESRGSWDFGYPIRKPAIVGTNAYARINSTLTKLNLDSLVKEWTVNVTLVRNPLIWGDSVVAAGDTTVFAFDEETGSQIWSRELSPIKGALAMDAARVYVLSDGLVALNRETGERVWTSSLPGAARDPVVIGNRVYVAGSRGGGSDWVAALEAETGSVAWTSTMKSGEGGITAPAATADSIYVSTTEGLVALRATDGSGQALPA